MKKEEDVQSLNEVFNEYCVINKFSDSYRKIKRKKLEKIASNDEDRIKILKKSIENKWRDLYSID